MSATNFKTENNTYRKLLGNGLTYRVPRFQRDYSWTDEQWQDLWDDLLATLRPDGEPAHYMGYLVLQSSDDKTFDIIDGQQRVTTISLLILAALRNLQRIAEENKDKNPVEAENARRRSDGIRQSYIGYLDPVTLVSRSKLSLNRNNDRYYQDHIVPLRKLPIRGFRASEHNLRKASDWFERAIADYAKKSADPEKSRVIAVFIDGMADRLFFTVITVTDELNAYKVFETLNARGVRLSSTDLLKNYLFAVLDRQRADSDEHELKILDDRWATLIERLGAEDFPAFLRIHWNSRHRFLRHSELFNVIRKEISSRASVFTLLSQMEEDLETYLALTNPGASGWPRDLKKHAATLNLFGVTQPFAMLLAARLHFSDEDFQKLLRACVVIAFRYNVIGNLPTNDQERVYSQAAGKFSAPTPPILRETLAVLKDIYPDDAAFRAAFQAKAFRTSQPRNRRIVRYILCALENHMAPGKEPDFESDTFNIEHIFPQNPESGWEEFPENDTDAFADRLGNMILLAKSANRDLGNATYAEKRDVYAASDFALARRVAEHNAEWTPGRLDTQQEWMAKQACSIWRIEGGVANIQH